MATTRLNINVRCSIDKDEFAMYSRANSNSVFVPSAHAAPTANGETLNILCELRKRLSPSAVANVKHEKLGRAANLRVLRLGVVSGACSRVRH